MYMDLKAVVLAAGKGTRMQGEDSDAPKVMRRVYGEPMLSHVLKAISFVEKKDIILVVGFGKEEVIRQFSDYTFAEQERQLGTGHAVQAAENELAGFQGSVLVCYGDMPVIRRETYEDLLHAHIEQENDCTILTGETSLPLAFGRIIRDDNGGFLRVAEDRDCTPDEQRITELNTGVYAFRTPVLLDALKDLKNDNAQGEYYLTDVPAIIRAAGGRIGIRKRELGDEILGVNTAEELLQAENILRRR